MKSLEKGNRLRNRQIVDLAGCLSSERLKSLAVTFLGFSHDTIQSIQEENVDDEESFKREIIRRWANMNSENQVQVTGFSCFHFLLDSMNIV